MVTLFVSQAQKFNVLINVFIYSYIYILYRGRDSSVGIATRYGLDGPGIESWWGGARFFAPVQTSSGAHPASCTMDTGSFLGGKSAGAWC